MTPDSANLIAYFLIFVRTATCLMILPGFTAVQVPMQIRLFLSIAASFSIYLVLEKPPYVGNDIDPVRIFELVAKEVFIGAILALPVRFLFFALSFMGEIVTQLIGLNPIPGTPIGDDQASTTLSGLLNVTAVTIFFMTGMHVQFIFGLIQSFTTFPSGELAEVSIFIESITTQLANFFSIAIRLGSPFFVYAVIMNLVAGLVNKLTPQIPVYFVSAPFVICGGLFLLTLMADDVLFLFNVELNRLLNQIF